MPSDEARSARKAQFDREYQETLRRWEEDTALMVLLFGPDPESGALGADKREKLAAYLDDKGHAWEAPENALKGGEVVATVEVAQAVSSDLVVVFASTPGPLQELAQIVAGSESVAAKSIVCLRDTSGTYNDVAIVPIVETLGADVIREPDEAWEECRVVGRVVKLIEKRHHAKVYLRGLYGGEQL